MKQFILLLAIACPAMAQATKDADRLARWEKDIAALEKKQTESSPEKGGVVFTGSSTIRLWDLAAGLPELKPINSGFGGSEIRDVTLFAERIVLKHEPKTIVFYAGDNDINSNRTPEQVRDDFSAFTKKVFEKLPKTRVYFISIKPSLARWTQYERQTKANEMVKAFCAKDERLGYIDVAPSLLGDDGKPRPELYVKDGLHLSPEGYKILTGAVKKALK
jgi:lysophospholipase L1-like esterase